MKFFNRREGKLIMRGRAIRGFCVLLFTGLALPGCAKLSHLEQLLTLQDYSNNNEDKQRFVEKADKRFEALLQEVKAGRLTRAMRQEDIRKAYGSPVYEQIIDGGNDARTLWMYRPQLDSAGAEKVYLYFDERGALLKWECESPSSPDKVS
jgi:hypothetical protein